MPVAWRCRASSAGRCWPASSAPDFFAGVWAVYGGLNTVAWTGVFTAIVKIGGVTLLTVLALKAMTPSGGVIDGFTKVIRDNIARSGIWHQALKASASASHALRRL